MGTPRGPRALCTAEGVPNDPPAARAAGAEAPASKAPASKAPASKAALDASAAAGGGGCNPLSADAAIGGFGGARTGRPAL